MRAARLGRVLVVDEADKAPLEAVCVLKALAEDGELTLGDGRRLLSAARAAELGVSSDTATTTEAETTADTDTAASARAGAGVIVMSPAFRLVVLANPPGWPFQGNVISHHLTSSHIISRHLPPFATLSTPCVAR